MLNRRKILMYIRNGGLYQLIMLLAVLGATLYIISKIWPLENVHGQNLKAGFQGASAVGRESVTPIRSPSKAEGLSMKDWVIERLYKEEIDIIKAVGIIECESRWNPFALHGNKDGTIDAGLWQTNLTYHPEIDIMCAMNYRCQTEAVIPIILKKGFKPWTCNNLIK